jgi:hypothetical protein
VYPSSCYVTLRRKSQKHYHFRAKTVFPGPAPITHRGYTSENHVHIVPRCKNYQFEPNWWGVPIVMLRYPSSKVTKHVKNYRFRAKTMFPGLSPTTQKVYTSGNHMHNIPRHKNFRLKPVWLGVPIVKVRNGSARVTIHVKKYLFRARPCFQAFHLLLKKGTLKGIICTSYCVCYDAVV